MATFKQLLDINEQRAGNALTRLVENFNAGKLSFESDLLAQTTQEYLNFFNLLGKPTIKPREMRKGDILRLSTLVSPMIELNEDLSVGFTQLDKLRSATKSLINLCSLERSGISDMLADTQRKTNELILWTNDSDPNFQWAGDTLNSNTKIDLNISTTWWSSTIGAIQLPVIGETTLAYNVENIVVQKPTVSNGIVGAVAGNNMEISDIGYPANAEADDQPLAPTFIGSEQVHSGDLRNINDENPTTWFEWENYTLPTVQTLKVFGPDDSRGAYIADSNGSPHVVIHGPIWTSADQQNLKALYKDVAASLDYSENITQDYGWKYYVKWPGESESSGPYWVVSPYAGLDRPTTILPLTIIVTFETPVDLSWIELTPYLPTDGPPKEDLTSVSVLPEGGGTWVELLERPLYLTPNIQQPINNTSTGIPVKNTNGIAVVACDVPKVKQLKLELAQPEAYKTLIGHQFFVKATRIQNSFMRGFPPRKVTKDITYYSRVPNTEVEQQTSSAGGGGFLSNVAGGIIGWLQYGTPLGAALGFVFGGLGSIFSSYHVETELGVQQYFDIFEAYRYSIGIKDLRLLQREYGITGIHQSTEFLFEKPIKAASLIVGETIPQFWPTTSKWITYQLSPNGVDWYDIEPQREDLPNTVVEFPEETTSIYFRATLSRPENKPNGSPVLTYYAIKAVPV